MPQIKSRSNGKKLRKKPDWDFMQQDHDVFKSSPEELARRKKISQSKNLVLVRDENLNLKIQKAKTDNSKNCNKNNAFLKQILYSNDQITDALVQSDEILSVVKDVFGDDPGKYRGLPNVTIAPNVSDLNCTLPDGSLIEGPSQMDLRSDRVMDKSALNELCSDDSDYDEADFNIHNFASKSVIDLDRFAKYMKSEKEHDIDLYTYMRDKHEQICAPINNNKSSLEAINDTAKVKRTLSCVNKDTIDNDQTNMTVSNEHSDDYYRKLQQVLGSSKSTNRGSCNVMENTETQQSKDELWKAFQLDTWSSIFSQIEHILQNVENSLNIKAKSSAWNPDDLYECMLKLLTIIHRLVFSIEQIEKRHSEALLIQQLNTNLIDMKKLVDGLTSDLVISQRKNDYLEKLIKDEKNVQCANLNIIKNTLASHNIYINLVDDTCGSKKEDHLRDILQNLSISNSSNKVHDENNSKLSYPNSFPKLSPRSNGVMPLEIYQHDPVYYSSKFKSRPAGCLQSKFQIEEMHSYDSHSQIADVTKKNEEFQQLQCDVESILNKSKELNFPVEYPKYDSWNIDTSVQSNEKIKNCQIKKAGIMPPYEGSIDSLESEISDLQEQYHNTQSELRTLMEIEKNFQSENFSDKRLLMSPAISPITVATADNEKDSIHMMSNGFSNWKNHPMSVREISVKMPHM